MSEKKGHKSSRSTMERRRFIRVIEGCPMTFVASDGVTGEGELFDISLRGLRFLSGLTLLNGEKIRAIFILSNGISLDLAGVIRHSHHRRKKKWIYGVEFFIRDYRDLKEHLKLNDYIMRARAEQDRMLARRLLKRENI